MMSSKEAAAVCHWCHSPSVLLSPLCMGHACCCCCLSVCLPTPLAQDQDGSQHMPDWQLKNWHYFCFYCNAENNFTLGSAAAQEVPQQADPGGKYCSSPWHRQEWCEAAALPGQWHLLRNLHPSSNLVPMRSIGKSCG